MRLRFVALGVLLLVQGACTQTVTRTRVLPVYETKQVQVGTKKEPVKETRDEKPALDLRNGRIAIVPFSNASARSSAGLAIAEELENWFVENKDDITRRMGTQCAARNPCIVVVSRTQLTQVMSEQELAEKGQVTKETAVRLKSILNIEYIVTGHVREAADGNWSIICKAIDTTTSEIAWSKKIDGTSLEGLTSRTGEMFLPHQVEVTIGETESPVFETQRVQAGTRTEEYQVSAVQPARMFGGVTLEYGGAVPGVDPQLVIGARWGDDTKPEFNLSFQLGPAIAVGGDAEIRFAARLALGVLAPLAPNLRCGAGGSFGGTWHKRSEEVFDPDYGHYTQTDEQADVARAYAECLLSSGRIAIGPELYFGFGPSAWGNSNFGVGGGVQVLVR